MHSLHSTKTNKLKQHQTNYFSSTRFDSNVQQNHSTVIFKDQNEDFLSEENLNILDLKQKKNVFEEKNKKIMDLKDKIREMKAGYFLFLFLF